LAQLPANRLRSMGVISDRGLQLGRLVDILFDEKDGKIYSLVVRPFSREALKGVPQDHQGNVLIPFSAVISIRDFIVVNERVLAVQQLKSQPQSSFPSFSPALPPKE